MRRDLFAFGEPELEFGFKQRTSNPKAGLTLSGRSKRKGVPAHQVGCCWNRRGDNPVSRVVQGN